MDRVPPTRSYTKSGSAKKTSTPKRRRDDSLTPVTRSAASASANAHVPTAAAKVSGALRNEIVVPVGVGAAAAFGAAGIVAAAASKLGLPVAAVAGLAGIGLIVGLLASVA